MRPTLTIAEAAAVLGLSPTAVRQLIAAGRLACYRLGARGGKIKLSHEDINVYVESCRSEVATARPTMKLKHIQRII